MVRRKLRIVPTGKARTESREDYHIFVTARALPNGQFLGDLSLVRRTDGRLLYPFEGAASIGPFESVKEARAAATSQAEKIIDADIAHPEP
ncbi:hypothetical protein QYH69_29300 [Paraburkholderia sp. SARCC-3016]|uniref:DUF6723 family protein n=1 Tax=Paraburkholderia sp. SARCC-3016 TaxID=3058611 RepID=UPI002808CCDB|nr:DUF6723 family protein [Paraburkholderia sp. SARCC-3016]MDQ7981332.1 hypothetical protein [Paraburkholderia sp. SARCC-3016]